MLLLTDHQLSLGHKQHLVNTLMNINTMSYKIQHAFSTAYIFNGIFAVCQKTYTPMEDSCSRAQKCTSTHTLPLCL